jgi:hypothetical protein
MIKLLKLKTEKIMKKYLPTIGLIATLAFASSNSHGQNARSKTASETSAPAAANVTVAVAASPENDAPAAAEAALTEQEKALEAQNEALAKVDEQLGTLTARAGRATTSARSLVIPKDAADAKSLSDAEEDMSVMARILEKAASGKSEKGERLAGHYVWAFTGSGGTPKNLFIDGYGALFFLNVNFPLLPPATKEKTTEPKSEADSEWESTQKELFHPREPASSLYYSYNFDLLDSSNPFGSSGPAEDYDEDKVNELKESLTAALKNASHIRRLKGDDTVTIVVTGRSAGNGPKSIRRSQNSSSSSSSSSTSWVMTSRTGSQAPAARLVIRARRADIESFQKDKLSPEDFRKKTSIFIY